MPLTDIEAEALAESKKILKECRAMLAKLPANHLGRKALEARIAKVLARPTPLKAEAED